MRKRGQDKKEKWLSLFLFFIFVVLLSVLLYQNQSFKISPHNHGHFFRQVWIKKTRVQRSQARMWSSKNVPSAIRLSPHFLQDSLFTHSLGTHGKLFTVLYPLHVYLMKTHLLCFITSSWSWYTSLISSTISYFILFLVFSGPHLRHIEVPRLGV